MRVNKQPWDFATPQEENNYLQAEVERLRGLLNKVANDAGKAEAEVERLRGELEFVRAERDRLRDAVEILRVEMEKKWCV